MVVLIPDELDFSGAMDGLVFIRQPQVRLKAGSWWFSLENPETIITPYQGSTTEVADADFIPDVTVRKNFEGDWDSWSIAAIGRALHKSDSITSSTYGFGISTGGKIKSGERGDDFRIVATYGSGIGRYQASAFNPDAVLDQDNQLKPINTLNGYIAYNHFWKPEKLSSSFNIGAYKAFHDENLVSPDINAVTYSASANIKWDPVRQVRLGVEYIYSYRGLEGDTNGAYHRIQLAAKYYFRYRNSIMNEKR